MESSEFRVDGQNNQQDIIVVRYSDLEPGTVMRENGCLIFHRNGIPYYIGDYVEVEADPTAPEGRPWLARIVGYRKIINEDVSPGSMGEKCGGPDYASSSNSELNSQLIHGYEVECQWLWMPEDAAEEWPGLINPHNVFRYGELEVLGCVASCDWNTVDSVRGKITLLAYAEYLQLHQQRFPEKDSGVYYYRQVLDGENVKLTPRLPQPVAISNPEYVNWCQERGLDSDAYRFRIPESPFPTTNLPGAPVPYLTCIEHPDLQLFQCKCCQWLFENSEGLSVKSHRKQGTLDNRISARKPYPAYPVNPIICSDCMKQNSATECSLDASNSQQQSSASAVVLPTQSSSFHSGAFTHSANSMIHPGTTSAASDCRQPHTNTRDSAAQQPHPQFVGDHGLPHSVLTHVSNVSSHHTTSTPLHVSSIAQQMSSLEQHVSNVSQHVSNVSQQHLSPNRATQQLVNTKLVSTSANGQLPTGIAAAVPYAALSNSDSVALDASRVTNSPDTRKTAEWNGVSENHDNAGLLVCGNIQSQQPKPLIKPQLDYLSLSGAGQPIFNSAASASSSTLLRHVETISSTAVPTRGAVSLSVLQPHRLLSPVSQEVVPAIASVLPSMSNPASTSPGMVNPLVANGLLKPDAATVSASNSSPKYHNMMNDQVNSFPSREMDKKKKARCDKIEAVLQKGKKELEDVGQEAEVNDIDTSLLALEIVEAFDAYCDEQKMTVRMAHQRLHERFQNLKRQNNSDLRYRLLTGELSANEFARCDAKDLAPASLKRKREEEANRYFQQQVLITSGPSKLIRKTHKGLEEVGDVTTDISSTNNADGATTLAWHGSLGDFKTSTNAAAPKMKNRSGSKATPDSHDESKHDRSNDTDYQSDYAHSAGNQSSTSSPLSYSDDNLNASDSEDIDRSNPSDLSEVEVSQSTDNPIDTVSTQFSDLLFKDFLIPECPHSKELPPAPSVQFMTVDFIHRRISDRLSGALPPELSNSLIGKLSINL